MKSKISYQKNDKVLVKSFAGPDTRVILRKRYIASQSELKLGVDGWEAQITIQKEVEKLRKEPFRLRLYQSRLFHAAKVPAHHN